MRTCTSDQCHCQIETKKADGSVESRTLLNLDLCKCIRNDVKKLALLYDDLETIRAIHASAAERIPTRTQKRTREPFDDAKRASQELQNQYEVEWNESIILHDHLRLYRSLGYTSKSLKFLVHSETTPPMPPDFPPDH